MQVYSTFRGGGGEQSELHPQCPVALPSGNIHLVVCLAACRTYIDLHHALHAFLFDSAPDTACLTIS